MTLDLKTIAYIKQDINRIYYKAIALGVEVSDVSPIGANLYTVNIGGATLTYMGTVDGTAKPITISGDIFPGATDCENDESCSTCEHGVLDGFWQCGKSLNNMKC